MSHLTASVALGEPAGLLLAGLLATALVHSSVILGAAWLLTRATRLAPRLEEVVWRAAMIGTAASVAIAIGPLGGIAPHPRFVYHLPDSGTAPAPGRSSSDPLVPVDLSGERAEHRPRAVEAGEPRGDSSSVRRPRGSGSSRGARSLVAAVPDRLGKAEPRGRPARAVGWIAALGGIWALVVGLLFARAIGARLLFAWVIRKRRSVSGESRRLLDGLRREAGLPFSVKLSVSRQVRSPLALPGHEICVPPRFVTELHRGEQRAVLAHELAHLARNDLGWAYWIRVVRTALLVQPIAVHAERRLALLAEVNSDDWAVRWSDSDALASSLAAIAQWCLAERTRAWTGTVALASEARHLPHRVDRLLSRIPPAVSGAGRGAVAVVIATILTAGVALPSLAVKAGAPVSRAGGSARSARGKPTVSGVSASHGAEAAVVSEGSPSLDDRWMQASRRAATLGLGEVVVVYRLGAGGTAAGSDGAHAPGIAVRIRARRSPSDTGTVLDPVDLSFGPGGGKRFLDIRPVFDLGVLEPDSSARWLRDRVADFARAGADPAVQMRFVEALGVHPGTVSEAYLVRLAWIHPVTAIRWRAVELLADHHSAHAFDELSLMLRRNPEPGVALRAVEVLAGYPRSRALPILQRVAADRPDPEVRAEAGRWVRRLEDGRG